MDEPSTLLWPSLAFAHQTLLPTTSFVHKYQLDRFKGRHARQSSLKALNGGDIPGERDILLIVVWGRGRDRMGTPPQIVHFVSWAEMAERNLSGTVRWFRISQTAGHPATADGWGRWEVIRDPHSAIMRKFYGSAPVVSEIRRRMTTGRR